VASRFVQGCDSLIDLVPFHARAGLESIGRRQFGLGRGLSLQEFAEEDVSVREGFFRNECVATVVLERVTESRGFGGTLSCMEVARGLDDFPELLVCV
jgi:hypothetical protein